ncbi:hypothetical protein V6N11_034222 [Hibiscus sabdariffa]|uniref:Uncharacterized protein n=2 Tax=Hibiscus sabdariffa TaxID=183260 RepID=A0ABR2NEA7_9ROSI
MFLWLVGHRNVKSNAKCVQRHLSNDSSCGVCDAVMEDIDHILWFCLMVISIWMDLQRPEKIVDFFGLNTKKWMMDNLTNDNRESIVARSQRLKEEMCSMLGAMRLQASHLANVDRSLVTWVRPPHGWCKRNVDGACCVTLMIASCGGVMMRVVVG